MNGRNSKRIYIVYSISLIYTIYILISYRYRIYISLRNSIYGYYTGIS